jgi:hypothetical protein
MVIVAGCTADSRPGLLFMLFGPLSVAMSLTVSPRSGVVTDNLRERGFAVDDEEWASVARGASTGLAGVDAPLAVVSLGNSRPLTVVSAIANAADEGYVPVLVADPQTADAVEPLLSEPFLLRDEQAGDREFLAIEDRILLSDDSYACLGASGPVRWFEDGSTDDPLLVLDVGGETVAALDSVDGLACPGPSVSAFQYSYARGDDGRFRVFEDGQAVGRYTGVSAMRADGFRPVPLPLVPEHHVREGGRLARATVVATVTDSDGVSYRSFT